MSEERPIQKKIIIAIVITSVICVAEIIGGILSNSLALQADAGHMVTDIAALLLSLLGFVIGKRKANSDKTFGYKRTEIIVALFNGVFLWILAIYFSYEAVLRFIQEEAIDGEILFIVASIGLVANIITASILHSHSHDNLNVRGAFLHVIGDLLGSVGAVIAGVCVIFWDLPIADPVVSILISGLIIYSSWNLVRESLHILLEGTPRDTNLTEIKNRLEKISGVASVHDLHVWTISSGLYSLSCHVVAHDISKLTDILEQSHELLEHHFGIAHATIQVEPNELSECQDCETTNLTPTHHEHHH